MSHFRTVCKSKDGRKDTVQEVEQSIVADKQGGVMSINSFSFNNLCSVVVAKLKTSHNQNSTIIQHKIEAGSNENILSFPIFKLLFPRAKKGC